MASAALAIAFAAPLPGMAAEKDKPAALVKKEAPTAKGATATKETVVKEVTIAKDAVAKDKDAVVKETTIITKETTTTTKETKGTKEAPAALAAPVAASPEAVPAAPPPPAAAPAKESSSFFGKLFGGGKKAEPASPAMRAGRGARPEGMPRPEAGQRPPPGPRPDAGPRPDMPSIGQELAAMEKEVDPKTLSAAEDVAKLLDTKDKVKRFIRMPAMRSMPMVERENPGQGDKIRKSMDDAVDKIAASYEDDAVKSKAIALAKVFTVDELGQLEKFYGSAAGKKMLNQADEISRSDAEFGRSIEMRQREKIREAVVKEMKKNDLKIPKGME
jgi:hypothetical protein